MKVICEVCNKARMRDQPLPTTPGPFNPFGEQDGE